MSHVFCWDLLTLRGEVFQVIKPSPCHQSGVLPGLASPLGDLLLPTWAASTATLEEISKFFLRLERETLCENLILQ